MSKEIKKILEDYKEETQKYFNQKTEEVKRHFEVVAERLEDKIQAVSEQVVANTESIVGIKEKLEEHDQRFDRLEENLEVVKFDTEFIKNELPQKVSREEFVALEKRASLLEVRNRS